MSILDGKKTAAARKERLAAYLRELKEKGEERRLAVLAVGEDAPSAMYARTVQRAALSVGMPVEICRYAEDISEEDLIQAVAALGERKDIAGILPMLPLPERFNRERVLNRIAPEKDVDGQTAADKGLLFSGSPCFAACTARAVIAVLEDYNITLEGKHVVIIGRSDVVGKPLAYLCLTRNATVTVCHSRTKNLPALTAQADILVAAVGKAAFVTPDMVKEGAVIIDVGINRADGRTVGDVSDAANAKASQYTPVPGGIGAVVSTIILENTAYGRR